MSCPSTTAIWEELITFGSIILDPVTTTSSTSKSASWAIAKGTEREMIAKALNKYLFKSIILKYS